MSIFQAKTEILPNEQKLLWHQLQPVAKLGFVLYGGTAVALRLGHRVSVDFDFFSSKELNRKEIVQAFPFIPQSTVLQDEPNSLSLLVCPEGKNSSVKISFFGAIKYGRVGVPDITDDGVLQVASLDDLMSTKVKVILQRAEAKDYRDIAEMIRAECSLSKGLAAAQVFYGRNFQPSESLKALTYFKDGDLQTLNNADKNTLVSAVSAVGALPKVELISDQLAFSE
jgi:predicted nucleotidyltransferase component of viral defense system